MKKLLFLSSVVLLVLLAVNFTPAAAFEPIGQGGWVKQHFDGQGYLADVSFADAQHGWAVGWDGKIIATRDGGATWSAQASGTTLDLLGVSFTDTTHGWAVGDSLILATTDGGVHWTPQANFGFTAVSFGDASHGCAVLAGSAAYTSDGGAHWTMTSVTPPHEIEQPLLLERERCLSNRCFPRVGVGLVWRAKRRVWRAGRDHRGSLRHKRRWCDMDPRVLRRALHDGPILAQRGHVCRRDAWLGCGPPRGLQGGGLG